MLKSSLTLSESELGEELTALAATLASAPHDSPAASSDDRHERERWKERKAALEQLQKFATEDISARPIFAQLLSSNIKVAFLAQFADRRTGILQAACRTVAAFAQYSTNRPLWASMCLWLLGPLLSLTANIAKHVVSVAGETLEVMASHSGFGAESLGELLKSCRAPHASVRLYALRTLLTLLREAKGTTQQVHVAKFSAPMSRVIAAGVADADERVRKAARQCYWGWLAMEPAAAAELYARFPASIRALVERDKADALRIVGAVETMGGATMLEGGTQRGGAVVEEQHHCGQPQVDARALQEDLQTVAAVRARTSSASQRLRQEVGSDGHTKSRLGRVLPSPSAPLAEGVQTVAVDGITRTDRSPSATGSPAHRAPATPSKAPDPSAVRSGELVDSFSEKQWKALQTALVNTDWEMRLDAVQSLSEALTSGRIGEHVEMRAEALTELTRRMSDPHFRVCLAAISGFRAYLSADTLSLLVEPHLESLLLALLTGTASRKEAVRREAAVVLVTLLDNVELHCVVPSLFHCLDDITTPIVRALTLEALQLIFERRWTAYLDPVNVGPVLRALVRQLHRAESEVSDGSRRSGGGGVLLWGPTVGAIKVLHHRVPEAVAKAVVNLDGDDQDLIRRVLEDRTEMQNKLLLMLPAESGDGPTLSLTDVRPATRNRRSPVAYEQAATRTMTAASLSLLSPGQQGAQRGARDRKRLQAAQQSPHHKGPDPAGMQLGTVTGATPERPQSPQPSAAAAVHGPLSSPPQRSSRSRPQPPLRCQAALAAAETRLFPTEFQVSHFIDPNEPSSASYPLAATGAGDGDRAFPAGALSGATGVVPGAQTDSSGVAVSTSPLIRGRRRDYGASSPHAALVGNQSPAADPGHSDEWAPQTLLRRLCAPDSTCDDLCCTLDAIRASLYRWRRDEWNSDTYQELLGLLFERFCTEHTQPHRAVRLRAFSVLRALLELPAMRAAVARLLSRALRVCRAGLDDAFYEVQQEAALVMHTLLRGCNLPVDLCLNGLAGVLEAWQRGQSRDDCTRGWLEMVSEVGRAFERARDAQAPKRRNSDPSIMMTEAVLRRVVRVVQWCAGHCAAEVRRTSVLVLVAMWLTMDRNALPFFASLTAAQRKLVSIYYNKALMSTQKATTKDVDKMLEELLSGSDDTARGRRRYRDLGAEMRAAGYPEPPPLAEH